MTLKLKKDEKIVCVYAKKARGPGWGNSPLWVIVADRCHKLREECIQPEEFTGEIMALYDVSEAVNNNLVRAIECKLRRAS